MGLRSWVPAEVDVTKPSAARVYDAFLGGGHNFAADREFARRAEEVLPGVTVSSRANRKFLRRVVTYAAERGIRQFLDIGSGIPTAGNVHEIALQASPDSRVVYVDNEAVAVAHSELMLSGNDQADVVCADVTNPADVLDAPATRRLLDFTEPVGVLAVTLGHYLPPQSRPAEVFGRYRDAVVPGSYLALTHLTDDFESVNGEEIVETMRSTRDNVFPRTRDEVLAFFDGFELVEPGLTTTSLWRPEQGIAPVDPAEDGLYAGVGRRK